MIKRLTFKKTLRWKYRGEAIFRKGDTFLFRDTFNIIVGSAGSGKTTLIEMVRSAVENFNGAKYTNSRPWHERTKAKDHVDVELILPENKDAQKLRAVCFRKDVDRSTYSSYSFAGAINIKPRNNMDAFKAEVSSKDCSGALIILDEPDLSVDTFETVNFLNTLLPYVVDQGAQVIMAVNNPYIISTFSEVLDMDSRKWITSQKYLENQTKNLTFKEKNSRIYSA